MQRRAPSYSPETLRGFIVFEGLDGSGTSTQAALLEKALVAAGRKAALTCEPSPGPIGNLIKMIMKGRLNAGATRERVDQQLAHLFAADRHDHLYNTTDGVEGLVQQGFTVVSTRYFFSSYAYNARTAVEFDLVERLNRDFPLPELVVYLTVPIEEAVGRLDRRGVRETYEHADELRRVAANYESILAPIRDRVIEMESRGHIDEIAARIAEEVLRRLQ